MMDVIKLPCIDKNETLFFTCTKAGASSISSHMFRNVSAANLLPFLFNPYLAHFVLPHKCRFKSGCFTAHMCITNRIFSNLSYLL